MSYNKKPVINRLFFCGERGIRTPGTPKGTTDFESAPFDHSGSFPLIRRAKLGDFYQFAKDMGRPNFNQTIRSNPSTSLSIPVLIFPSNKDFIM